MLEKAITKKYKNQFWPINPDDDSISIVTLMDEGRLLPFEKKTFPYTDIKKSKVVEGLLLGYPQIFQVVIIPKGKDSFIVLHGYNDLKAIVDFIHSNFNLKGLTLLNKLDGFKFSDLPLATQRSLKETTLLINIVTSKLSQKEKEDMFDRLKF